jgi:hypothetical protein
VKIERMTSGQVGDARDEEEEEVDDYLDKLENESD